MHYLHILDQFFKNNFYLVLAYTRTLPFVSHILGPSSLSFGAGPVQNMKNRICFYFFLYIVSSSVYTSLHCSDDSESGRNAASSNSIVATPTTTAGHIVESVSSIRISRAQPPRRVCSISLFNSSWVAWCCDI